MMLRLLTAQGGDGENETLDAAFRDDHKKTVEFVLCGAIHDPKRGLIIAAKLPVVPRLNGIGDGMDGRPEI